MSRTPYEQLGVTSDATLQDIKRAYRRAARRFHPDTGATPDPARFDAISRAFGMLRDPAQREAYDRNPTATLLQDDVDGDAARWDEPGEGEPDAEPDVHDDLDAEPPVLEEPSVSVRTPGRDTRWLATAATLGLLGSVLPLAVAGTIGTGLGPLILGCVLGAWACVRMPAALPPRQRAMAAAVAAVALTAAGPIAPLLQGLVLGWGAIGPAVALWHEQRRLDRIIAPAALRDHQVFGQMPPGVAASLLDQLCQTVRPPAGLVLRCSDPQGVFSHAVVNGERVALLASSLEESGLYSWSGPSLLAMPAGDDWPFEVLRADFTGTQAQVRELAGAQAQVASWMVLICPDGGEVRGHLSEGMPVVVDPGQAAEQIESFLNGGNAPEVELVVDQRLVCRVAQVFH